MDTRDIVNSDGLRTFNRWHLLGTLLLLLLLLLLPWVAGIGPNSWRACCEPAAAAAVTSPVAAPVTAPVVQPEPAAPPAAVSAPAPAPASTPAVTPDIPPNARVFFEVNKFDVPSDIDTTLKLIVAYLTGHPDAKAVVSGFHDPRGNQAQNEQLALNRARAVRSALERAGIARERVVMAKPQETAGTGSLDDARRVEVGIQP